ncbi:MAG: hypothetical protein LBE11_07750 [Prevotellaceae bacterium]|jgi:hypothetical protein|nr:hypothetical protein [Prevotellaceae bacterium]
MEMKEKELQLVSFEQAKRLKALGFDWECFAWIDGNEWRTTDIDLNYGVFPTVALALKWIRDVKNQTTIVSYDYYCNVYYYLHNGNSATGEYYTYEAAESALLDEILKILEQEKKK